MVEKEKPSRPIEQPIGMEAPEAPVQPVAQAEPAVPQIESGALMASAALIGLTALIEEELLLGMLVGAGIMYASGWVSSLLGAAVRPALKTTVKAGYLAAAKTSEVVTGAGQMVAGAGQRLGEFVSEARSEEESGRPLS